MAYCFDCFRELAQEGGVCPYCGYDPAKDEGEYPLALPHGSVLAGQYITGRVLGQGGFGITYAAYDVRLTQKVAIKEFMPQGMAFRVTGSPQMTAYSGRQKEDYAYGLDLFLSEARTLAKFQGNPGIVGVRTFFEENGTAYFVMDYVQGEDLVRYIARRGGKLPWQEALHLLVPVMGALSAVHREGIIHRDVAPDNIFITKGSGVKLLDFGAARYSLGDRSQSLDMILKPGYAPVEQYYRRGRQGPYTDVYALSACLYAAITGQIPPESVERTNADALRPPSAMGIPIPAALERAILRGLAVRPEERYQTMEELKTALLTPDPGPTPGPEPKPGPEPGPEPRPRPEPKPKPGPRPEPVLRPDPAQAKRVQRYFLQGLLLILGGPVVGIALMLTLYDLGINYTLYIVFFSAGFILPPAAVLLLAKRYGMDGAMWKRLLTRSVFTLIALACVLAAPYAGDGANPLGVLLGAWLIFFDAFLQTQATLPGHPKRKVTPESFDKLTVIGFVALAWGLYSFLSGLF